MFKILQISNKAPYPSNDGSSIAIYNMAKGLVENGVELHLLCINTKKHFKPDTEVPETFKLNSNYSSVYRNTDTSLLGALLNLFSKQSYFVSRFYFEEFEKKLIEKLNQTSFDIVQVEGLFMGVYIDIIRKHSKAKIVLRAHNIEHFIWKRHIANEKSGIRKVYLSIQNNRLKKFELRILSQIDAVVPITKTDEIEFRKLDYGKKLYACITGVDVKAYQNKLNLPEKAKTVFYFGSMDWMPNQEAVIWFLNNCWDAVHKAVPESRLILAGRGMPLEFFHITKPNVLIIENVEDGKAFYQQHQVMIVPLWSGSGLRIKIIEGMAYGKAIISTTIGAEGINYSNNKNIIIADNPIDFSNSVIKLLKDKESRIELEREAALFSLEQFDNSRVVAGLIEFYKNLLSE